MEVHHHAHSSHQKKWHEYILEFLMLFLAVFLGFLAENFREHKVEKHRAKEHMHTVVENLKYDTTRYIRNERVNNIHIRGLDSFSLEVSQALDGNINSNKLYYYFLKYGKSILHGVPVLNETGMAQLKSSGLIRMIRNDNLVDEMGDYYSRRVAVLETMKSMLFIRRDAVNETYKTVFSSRPFEHIIRKDSVWGPGTRAVESKYYDELLRSTPPLKLLTTDSDKLERLYTDIAELKWVIESYNSVIRYNRQGADSLIKHIKQEYGFK